MGRPLDQDADQELETLVLGAYITRDRTSFFKDVPELRDRPDMNINTLPSIQYVHRVVQKALPERSISLSKVKRLIKRLEIKYAAPIMLAREGERAFWAHAVPKMENDCDRPDEAWQSDARYLSFYVKYKGKVVRVVLIIVIDVFSRCMLRFALVPREDQDKEGRWHNIDFTGKQVAVLLASTMHVTKRRCYYFVTDKGTQYQAVAPYLIGLTTDKEPPIIPVPGFPGHPWCRGIVEVYNYLIDELLRELPGFVEDENDPLCRRAAQRRNDLLEFEVLEKAIKAKLEWRNNQSIDGKPSRYDVWKNTPGAALAAPSDDRLALLIGKNRVARKTAVVRDVGIEHKRTFYRLEDSDESYDRWMKAAAQRREVPFCAISFDDELVVLVDLLDGHGWEQVVPQSKQRPSRSNHVGKQHDSVQRMHGEVGEAEKAYIELLAARMGGQPKTDAVSREPFFPEELAALAAAAPDTDTSDPPTPETTSEASQALSPVSRSLNLNKSLPSTQSDSSPPAQDTNLTPDKEESTPPMATQTVTPAVNLPQSQEEEALENAKKRLAERLRQQTGTRANNARDEVE